MCMFFLCIFCIFKFWFVSSLLAGLFSKRERERERIKAWSCMHGVGRSLEKMGKKKTWSQYYMNFQNKYTECSGWWDSSVVRRTSYSCRWRRSNFQHQHGSSQPSVFTDQKALASSYGLGIHMTFIWSLYSCR